MSRLESPRPETPGLFAWPPPVRLSAPLLVLVFGLTATWFGYWLALDVGLAKDLEEARARAEAVTQRLAVTSELLIGAGQIEAVKLNVSTLMDVPDLVIAGIVDGRGTVLADSTLRLAGLPVRATPLAAASSLIHPTKRAKVELGENDEVVAAAYPFSLGSGIGWALISLDRHAAVEMARQGARAQLGWMSGAMLLLSFALWAVLDFSYTRRLAALARNMQGIHTSNQPTDDLPGGSDEIGRLAQNFTLMMSRLRGQEVEQMRLEREVLNVSESERQRIGHDLHDGLGQRLTAASMATQALLEAVKNHAPELTAHGDLVARQLREAIAEARALSHGLAPVSMEAEGLMQALAEMASSVSSSGQVRCVLDCPQPVHVSSVEVGSHLFRIAQEAVNNALKHAAPSEIRIGLEQKEGRLVLEIEDDGSGLDESQPAADGLGLRVMRYRARLIGAVLEAGTAAAGGTCIRCTLPLPITS